MNERPDRPVLELLSGHWLSLIGAALVTTAGFSWLFVLPMQVRGRASNPYIGLVVFIAIPVIFCLGLALIPIRRLPRTPSHKGRCGERAGPQDRSETTGNSSRRYHFCESCHRDPGHLSGCETHGTAHDSGFVGRQEARLSSAFHRVGEAEVGPVTGLGIQRAGARRFAAFDEALRNGAPTQGDRFRERKRDGRGGVRHELILRQNMP